MTKCTFDHTFDPVFDRQVMEFIEGIPLPEAHTKLGSLSERKRRVAKRMILGR